MIITTTDSVDGHKITAYCGVCTGEAILGANIVRDMFAGVRDIVGGRSGSYEKVIRAGKDAPMQLLVSISTTKPSARRVPC